MDQVMKIIRRLFETTESYGTTEKQHTSVEDTETLSMDILPYFLILLWIASFVAVIFLSERKHRCEHKRLINILKQTTNRKNVLEKTIAGITSKNKSLEAKLDKADLYIHDLEEENKLLISKCEDEKLATQKMEDSVQVSNKSTSITEEKNNKIGLEKLLPVVKEDNHKKIANDNVNKDKGSDHKSFEVLTLRRLDNLEKLLTEIKEDNLQKTAAADDDEDKDKGNDHKSVEELTLRRLDNLEKLLSEIKDKNANGHFYAKLEDTVNKIEEFIKEKQSSMQELRDEINDIKVQNAEIKWKLSTQRNAFNHLNDNLREKESTYRQREIEKENEQLRSHLNALKEKLEINAYLMAKVNKTPTYKDIAITFKDPEEINRNIKKMYVLGEGGNGKAELVYYGGMYCVLKTSHAGKIPLDELQIMVHLKGAGGAPELIGATSHSFLCTYVGDKTLENLMRDVTSSQHFLINAMEMIAKQVRELHNHNISHNDLKENNIVFNSNSGKFSIIDFGLSREFGDRFGEIDASHVHWMAPEIRAGEVMSPASDIYSLGIMLGKMIFMFQKPLPAAQTLVGQAIMDDPKMRPSIDEFIGACSAMTYGREEKDYLALNAYQKLKNIYQFSSI